MVAYTHGAPRVPLVVCLHGALGDAVSLTAYSPGTLCARIAHCSSAWMDPRRHELLRRGRWQATQPTLIVMLGVGLRVSVAS